MIEKITAPAINKGTLSLYIFLLLNIFRKRKERHIIKKHVGTFQKLEPNKKPVEKDVKNIRISLL
jgi:hypothetical protein